MRHRLLATLAAMVLVLVGALGIAQLAGCGSGGGTATTTSTNSGALKMYLTDKASDEFSSAWLSIKEVRVVPEGMENADEQQLPLVASYPTPLTVNVLSLKFLLQALTNASIPAGNYSQIRLVLADNQNEANPANYVILASDPTGTKVPLKTPSGQESGLKIKCNFTVTAGSNVEIVVDFDPNTAIVPTDQGYSIKPAGIRVVEVQTLSTAPAFGSITGTLMAIMSWSSVNVDVVPQGASSPAASSVVFSQYTSSHFQGAFSAFVPPGTYRIRVNAVGFLPYSSQMIGVKSGAESALGTINLVPITPPPPPVLPLPTI
jgi:hypothetical protein